MRAQKELHNLAEKIDQVHKEVNDVKINQFYNKLYIKSRFNSK